MTVADIAKYPQFAHYVRHDIPYLVHVKPVVYNLKTKGNLTDAEIRHCTAMGNRTAYRDQGPFARPVQRSQRLRLHQEGKSSPDRDR